MDTGFFSEDGTTFTSIKDDIRDIKKEVDINKNDPFGVDIKSLPEEHRDVFTKLLGELKERTTQLDGLKNNADLANAIKGLKESFSKPVEEEKSDDDSDNDNPFKELTFEEGDYYRKFLEPIMLSIRGINKQLKNIAGDVSETRASSWKNSVKDFIIREKLSKEIVLKMDELAKSMGVGVYNDLPRLSKLAKMELGLDNKKIPENNDEDDELNQKRKNIVNFSRRRSASDILPPKVNTMAEAWDAAEDQLAEQD